MDKAKFKRILKGQAYLDTGYFMKGRIKRMRSGKDKGLGWCNVKTIRKIASPKLIYKTYYYQGAYPTITRWNRH